MSVGQHHSMDDIGRPVQHPFRVRSTSRNPIYGFILSFLLRVCREIVPECDGSAVAKAEINVKNFYHSTFT